MAAIGPEDKKKLYILLGLGGLLGLAVLVLYHPFSKAPTPAPGPLTVSPKTGPAAPAGPPMPGAPAPPGGAAPPGAMAASPPAGGAGTAGAAPVTQLVSVERYRQDPFFPYYTKIPPTPPPPPTPTPVPPPVPLPQPESVPLNGPESLPGVRGGASERSGALIGLPPVRPQAASLVPDVAQVTGGFKAGGGSIVSSANKRLAGVIMSEGVKALLEIEVGGQVVDRVVQPGDEVEGIRILRFERLNQGGQQVSRLIVLENGEERSVELKPAASSDRTGGTEGGAPGTPGGRGGGPPPAPF